jgi:hypothetical protein
MPVASCSWLALAGRSGRPDNSIFFSQLLLFHQARHAGNGCIFGFLERRDYVGLFFSCPILAELEFSFNFGRRNFESNNVTEHAFAVARTQAFPLLAIGRLECLHQLIQNALQI